MAKKPGNGGAVFLWLVMFVVLGIAGAEFFGPTQGWLKPTISSVRAKITGARDEYRAKLERERLAREEAARAAAAEGEAFEEDVTPHRRLADGKGFSIRSSMNDDALQYVQTDGEVTPADLMMAIAAVPKRSVAETVVDKFDKKDLTPGSQGYKSAFQELYDTKLTSLSKPEVGKTYKLRKKDKKRFQGRLLVLGKNRAVFTLDKKKELSITGNDLSTRSLKIIFPELYARKYAEYHLAKASGVSTKPSVAGGGSTPVAIVRPPMTDPEPDKPEPIYITKLPSLKEYDPSYAATPKHLGQPIKEFNNWISYQNQRLKWRLAKKMYAKQHGKDVVLYMETSKSYRMQAKDVRRVYGEQFWHMWARKLREQGKVRDEKFAHLVLLDDKATIIGGSKVKDSKNIWVK